MERRDYLKTAGGIGATALLGGAGLMAMSGPAAAAAQNYGDVTITSDDGSVEYVAIYGDSIVTWDGFDTPATQFSIDIDGRVVGSGAGWINLHETGAVALDSDWGNDEALSGPGTSGHIKSAIGLRSNGNHDPTTDWHVVGSDPDNYGLPSNSIDPALLEADTDGSTKDFTVEIRSKYVWYDSGGNEIFSKTFTAPIGVTVTNEPATASGSDGSGDDGAVGA